mmetsp:Transcript_12104/g.26974  ORF Transcript_12104/g.26974 Transcript_12104/m.26974 type:complete len:248 (+) Transcript_12104:747-1490(+)
MPGHGRQPEHRRRRGGGIGPLRLHRYPRLPRRLSPPHPRVRGLLRSALGDRPGRSGGRTDGPGGVTGVPGRRIRFTAGMPQGPLLSRRIALPMRRRHLRRLYKADQLLLHPLRCWLLLPPRLHHRLSSALPLCRLLLPPRLPPAHSCLCWPLLHLQQQLHNRPGQRGQRLRRDFTHQPGPVRDRLLLPSRRYQAPLSPGTLRLHTRPLQPRLHLILPRGLLLPRGYVPRPPHTSLRLRQCGSLLPAG